MACVRSQATLATNSTSLRALRSSRLQVEPARNGALNYRALDECVKLIFSSRIPSAGWRTQRRWLNGLSPVYATLNDERYVQRLYLPPLRPSAKSALQRLTDRAPAGAQGRR